MNQILGMGTAIVGTSILVACPLKKSSPSIYIYFGGSLIYVASEFMGAKAQKAFLKANTEEIDQIIKSQKEGGGDAQKAIIEKKLKEEEDKLGFVNKRKMWMIAITAVYFAATASAIVERLNMTEVTPCTNGALAMPKQLALASALGGAYSLVVGAGAGSMISALIAAIAGAVIAYKQVELGMGDPTTRAIAFGVAAALATTITMMLGSEAKKIEDNIKKLKELLEKFKKDTDTAGGLADGTSVTPRGSNITTNPTPGKINPLPNGNQAARSCWANTSKGMEFSESACKSPFRVPRAKLNANLNLPTLQSVTGTAGDMAQAVAEGDMARADLLAGQLAANATRMKQVKDSLLKQLNDKLKAKGKKPLELDKEVNKRIGQMEAGVNKNLASKGFGPLASSGASLGKDIPADLPTITPKDVGEKEPIAIDNNKVSESVDEALSEGGVVEEKQASLSESLEGFETTEDDISKRSDDSIFDQLSTRYLLNYHRFFERKKEEEAPAE
jgi:hypothetical protein